MREKALNLLVKLDKLFSEVVKNKNYYFLNELDNLLIEILNISEENALNDEILSMVILAFNQKVNLIYKLCPPENQNPISLEELQIEFKTIEFIQFNINNNFVLGIVTVDEIESFKKILFGFKNKLYAIPISDTNLLEIAKMKSKIQHYETNILEDEDILKTAYNNSN